MHCPARCILKMKVKEQRAADDHDQQSYFSTGEESLGSSTINIVHNIGHIYILQNQYTILSSGHKYKMFQRGTISVELDNGQHETLNSRVEAGRTRTEHIISMGAI